MRIPTEKTATARATPTITRSSAATTALLEWTNVSTSEDYTHFSMWTASTAGTFLWSGTIVANAVV